MPSSTIRQLSPQAFREEVTRKLEFDLPAFQQTYRLQRLRMILVIALGLTGFSLGLLSFFPATMLIFLFVLYLLYYFGFGKSRRKQRVQKDSDLRRMLVRATISATGLPFTFQTHRYMPVFVFRESELFYFKPDVYDADELVEISPGGKITFSHIQASEKVDAFERAANNARSFEGWLFRIFPARNAQPFSGDLPSTWLNRFTPDQVWLAVPQHGALYHQRLLSVEPDFDACYDLYQAIGRAAAISS